MRPASHPLYLKYAHSVPLLPRKPFAKVVLGADTINEGDSEKPLLDKLKEVVAQKGTYLNLQDELVRPRLCSLDVIALCHVGVSQHVTQRML